uniref:Fer1 n=1 Tax=Arundo donax TaxID=35708 RepID=A0A0A9GML9_ARUDO
MPPFDTFHSSVLEQLSLLPSGLFLKQHLIKVPHPMPLAHSSQLGDILRDLLDGINLLLKKFTLDEVG